MDFKLSYIIGIIVVIVVIILAAAAYAGVFTKPSKITMAGSTSVQPVAQALADQYHKENPKVNITVTGGGSAVGLTDVQQGTANIGTYSSKLSNATANANYTGPAITQYTIANDGIIIVVNPSNNVSDLNTSQIESIFAGNITTWSQVGGNSSKIDVYTRESGSGTRSAFTSLVMNGSNITSAAIVQSSSNAIFQAVAGDPNGIGYDSLASLTSTVKALKVNGVTPSASTVASGAYTTQRPFLFLTKGNATGSTQAFINWVLSPEGQKIVQQNGAVPVGPTS
jgi:phosphate transport system substrate-binding protein